MSRSLYQAVLVCIALLAIGSVWAEEKIGKTNCSAAKCCADKCDTKKCSECTESKKLLASKCNAQNGKIASCAECPVAAAMDKLPRIVFVVGEQTTCGAESAKRIAHESGTSIKYAVAEKTYENEVDAKLALLEETERFVNEFTNPQVCKNTGTTTIAGKNVCCSDAVARTAELAKAAMAKVKLTFLVGEKTCHCPREATQMAEKTGEPTVYVVGAEKTNCETTARLRLARAKYKAAVEAIAKADATTDTVKR